MKQTILLIQFLCITFVFANNEQLGVTINEQNGRFIITDLKEGSLAEKAGMEPLHELIAVGQDSVQGMSINGVKKLLISQPGDTLDLYLKPILKQDSAVQYQIIFKTKEQRSNKYPSTSHKLKKYSKPQGNGYLGLRYKRVGTEVVILEVNPDSPASKSGIQEEDVLWGIDGTLTKEISDEELKYYLSGNAGDTIAITILRGGTGQLQEYLIEFENKVHRQEILYHKERGIRILLTLGGKVLSIENSYIGEMNPVCIGAGVHLKFNETFFMEVKGRVGFGKPDEKRSGGGLSFDDDDDWIDYDSGESIQPKGELLLGEGEASVGITRNLHNNVFILVGGGVNWIYYELSDTPWDDHGQNKGLGAFAGLGVNTKISTIVFELSLFKNRMSFQSEKSGEFHPGFNVKAIF